MVYLANLQPLIRHRGHWYWTSWLLDTGKYSLCGLPWQHPINVHPTSAFFVTANHFAHFSHVLVIFNSSVVSSMKFSKRKNFLALVMLVAITLFKNKQTYIFLLLLTCGMQIKLQKAQLESCMHWTGSLVTMYVTPACHESQLHMVATVGVLLIFGVNDFVHCCPSTSTSHSLLKHSQNHTSIALL